MTEEEKKPQAPQASTNKEEEAQPSSQEAAPGIPGEEEPAADGQPTQPQGETAPEGAGQPAEEPESELEKAQRLAAENFDKFLRLQAEFENFKKRILKEKNESLKYAQMPILRDLVGIMDNFERALEHARANPGQDQEGLVSGVEMVLKQLHDTFERFGMVRISAVGEMFDPTRHEAMSVVETEEEPENKVMAEFQAGYTLHDRVVRPAMVTVSKNSGGAKPDAAEPIEN